MSKDKSVLSTPQSSLKKTVKKYVPKKVWKRLQQIKKKVLPQSALDSSKQDLDLYWDPEMAEVLETWGEGNAWNEIQFFMAGREGKVLDIACGTGKTMEILSKNKGLELQGCDISDFLLQKAAERGLNKDNLKVMDATKMTYADKSFDYSYSIGSLEHFTESGIDEFLKEASRITKKVSLHMIPVSRTQKNEGWMKTVQSFHNNSTAWWVEKCKKHFKDVQVLDSTWNDDISLGIWLVCYN